MQHMYATCSEVFKVAFGVVVNPVISQQEVQPWPPTGAFLTVRPVSVWDSSVFSSFLL